MVVGNTMFKTLKGTDTFGHGSLIAKRFQLDCFWIPRCTAISPKIQEVTLEQISVAIVT